MFGLRIKGGRVEGRGVKFVENRLILGKFYSTLLPIILPQSNRPLVNGPTKFLLDNTYTTVIIPYIYIYILTIF